MSIFYRGLSIDASYQVSVHLAGFQRRRLKCEKLTDDRWQKLILPLAKWANKNWKIYWSEHSITGLEPEDW